MTNEIFGWVSILWAVVMGLWMGIKFQDEEWLGGYGALARRMVRLAHIALAALGMINAEFGRSVGELTLSPRLLHGASFAFIVAGVSMPACCLLIAKNFGRFELFALPQDLSLWRCCSRLEAYSDEDRLNRNEWDSAENQQLTELEMRLPGFLERAQTLFAMPSLLLLLLTQAGMVPAGVEIEYREYREFPAEQPPECDLAAITSFTAQIEASWAAYTHRKCGEGELLWSQILADFWMGRCTRSI